MRPVPHQPVAIVVTVMILYQRSAHVSPRSWSCENGPLTHLGIPGPTNLIGNQGPGSRI